MGESCAAYSRRKADRRGGLLGWESGEWGSEVPSKARGSDMQSAGEVCFTLDAGKLSRRLKT